ncbi:hypothetical protein [Neobacillus sp. SAB-20_R2A]|uniref:hypothetical protein n=1 Tax=Neobacillus sp. SAB-20_R2A TaxID=3120519 RepID=UPI003C6E4151
MNAVIGMRFQTSEIKNMFNPDSDICQSIIELERFLFDFGLFDEMKELYGIPYSQLIYKKQGEEILTIYVNKSNYYIKLIGYDWNVIPFFQLPIELEFTIEKTLSWRLTNLDKVETRLLEDSLKQAIYQSKDLKQLKRFILVVIKAYSDKASFLTANKLIESVMEHFWEGNITEISQLYNHYTHSKSEQLKQFMVKCERELNFTAIVNPNRLSATMDIDPSKFSNIILTIQSYLEQSLRKYIHSIKNLWFDLELIQDQEEFHKKAEDIRSIVVATQEFINEMSRLIEKEETEVTEDEPKTENIVELNVPENGLLTYLVEKSKVFLDKKDIFQELNPSLAINEPTLEKLSGDLANRDAFKEEYKNLIRIIFEKSQNNGFTVREKVRTFFLGKYDNEEVRKDFERRYNVKRLFVKSTLEIVFENMMKKLIECNMVKEEKTIIQFSQQEKITYNYNFQIYEVV